MRDIEGLRGAQKDASGACRVSGLVVVAGQVKEDLDARAAGQVKERCSAERHAGGDARCCARVVKPNVSIEDAIWYAYLALSSRSSCVYSFSVL